MHPPGELVMGWGILPAVPHKFLDQALAQLDLASELSIGYGSALAVVLLALTLAVSGFLFAVRKA